MVEPEGPRGAGLSLAVAGLRVGEVAAADLAEEAVELDDRRRRDGAGRVAEQGADQRGQGPSSASTPPS